MLFPLKTFVIVSVSITTNALLWLDSFDRYLSTRYHMNLSLMIPEWAFTPSRTLQEELSRESITPVRESNQDKSSEASPPELTSLNISAPANDSQPSPPKTKETTASVPIKPAPQLARLAEQPQQNQGAPKMLFAGDSMMQGVAPLVISKLKKQHPGALLLDLSKQSTGLTVRRYFDWPTKIREETEKRGIKDVVIFLGPNDPWDITENRKTFAFPSQEWEDKYRQRVVEVLQHASNRQMRVVWIGLPAMKNERVKKGAVIQNRIFREECARFGFLFLDTEELFGRLSEPFSKYIPDSEKGQILVRADDGTHFTTAGLRMLADRLLPLLEQQNVGPR